LISQPSRSRFAVVRSAETSEPAFASVTQNAPSAGCSGVPNIFGAHASVCSAVPLAAKAASGRPVPKIPSVMPAQPHADSSSAIGIINPESSCPTCM